MSHRSDQIASVIRQSVQTRLAKGLHDPRIRGLISVTKVALSDDLSQATVFISVMPWDYAELTLHGLRHAAPHLRRQLGQGARLKRLPRLTFRLDESLKRQAELDAALAAVRNESPTPEPAEPQEPPS